VAESNEPIDLAEERFRRKGLEALEWVVTALSAAGANFEDSADTWPDSIRERYFAMMRDAAGRTGETIDNDSADVAEDEGRD
jgi:hypothetical protein